MLDRGLWDALPFWPYSAYPISFNIILFTLYKFNKALEERGIWNDQIYKGVLGFLFVPIFYYPVSIINTIINFYFLYIVGWTYLFFIPLTVIGMIPAILLGFLPYGHYIMPIICILIIIMTSVMLGLFYLEPIAEWNVVIIDWLMSF